MTLECVNHMWIPPKQSTNIRSLFIHLGRHLKICVGLYSRPTHGINVHDVLSTDIIIHNNTIHQQYQHFSQYLYYSYQHQCFIII